MSRTVVRRLRPARVPGRGPDPVRRAAVRLIAAVDDPGSSGRLPANLRVTDRRGREVVGRAVTVGRGDAVAIPVGVLTAGRYVARLDLRDRAGNPAVASRRFLVR